ncbi:MAG: LPS export ABC transporter periplasmic protein LptC [Syntrophus sp. (in: bacteria)]|nr:LPS export ABC transporter periplasmic protein LptC [Syntrophus sp. (in: bacteria)]
MKNRTVVVCIAFGCIIVGLSLALYFFSNKPQRPPPPKLDQGARIIVFKNVHYSGEKKGTVDWEIKAEIARKFIDTPDVEMEVIKGQYKPKPDVTVFFNGSRGKMNTEEEKGNIDDVDIIYKDNYRLKTKSMDFDFKKSLAWTNAPVDIEGSKLSLKGVGMTANTSEQTVRIERDVSGFIETGKGQYRFSSDKFFYMMKENLYILDGKVIMRGENMNLLCDRLNIFSEGNEVEKAEATGKVRLLSKGTIAKSEKAVYDFKEDKVVMSGSPIVLKDKTEMEGESIVYNLSKGTFFVNRPKMRVER